MTLFEIKAAAAAYLGRYTDELIVNSVDLGLSALNQIRMDAELNNDFEFTRTLVTVNVDGVVGGSLDTAVDYVTGLPVRVKRIADVGLFDTVGNLRAVEWTTVAQGLDVQRMESLWAGIRYPTDGQAEAGVFGYRRFVFSGRRVFFFPIPQDNVPITFKLGLEVYSFTPDWLTSDLGSGESFTPWTTYGHQYLQWGTTLQLNNLFKAFVPRQEGNLAPPDKLMADGLDSLKSWDTLMFEQSRRHSR